MEITQVTLETELRNRKWPKYTHSRALSLCLSSMMLGLPWRRFSSGRLRFQVSTPASLPRGLPLCPGGGSDPLHCVWTKGVPGLCGRSEVIVLPPAGGRVRRAGPRSRGAGTPCPWNTLRGFSATEAAALPGPRIWELHSGSLGKAGEVPRSSRLGGCRGDVPSGFWEHFALFIDALRPQTQLASACLLCRMH